MDDFPWGALGLATCNVWIEERLCRFAEGRLTEGEITGDPEVPTVAFGSPREANTRHIDVRFLARSLFPSLAHHNIDSVRDALGLELASSAGAHDALLVVLQRLLEHACTLGFEHLATLRQLFPPDLAGLVGRLHTAGVVPSSAVAGSHASVPEETAPATASADHPHVTPGEALAAEGPVGQTLIGFEPREGQQRMAEGIAAAIEAERSVAAEAGPGTGKTFAYLVPLLLHLRGQPQRRAVVSTRTRQLQEQLYHKDLPLLARCLAGDVRTAMLKGRENYLCLRRWQIAVGELVGGLDRQLVHELAPVATWLVESATGDIEENGALLASPVRDQLWPRLRDDGRHCLMLSCPHLPDCFSVAARRRAQAAQLVVVNHALLLADAMVGHRILGRYDVLVVDEAHALEGAARQAFTATLSKPALDALLADLGSVAGRRSGWLGRAGAQLSTARRRSLGAEMRAVRSTGRQLFQRLDATLPEASRARLDRLPDLDPADERHRDHAQRLHDELDAAAEDHPDAELRAEAETLVVEAQTYLDLLRCTLSPPGDDAVLWSERRPEGLSVHHSPLEVKDQLAAILYGDLRSLVLTSATLSPTGDPAYLQQTIGTDGAPGGLDWLVLPPAFSYRDRMSIFVPRYLPPIEDQLEAHAEALASLITRLQSEVGRRMLVLFTSYRLLSEVNRRLAASPGIIAQSPGDGRSRLVQRLRAAHGGAVLLGADSFWEGVDLPGDLLELLVITRLPFPVPTDPVLSALADRLRAHGADPFSQLSLPRAALKLRQGIGRLLRTASDRGAVILTDDRLFRRTYGAWLAEALPVEPQPAPDEQVLLQDLRAWFAADARTTVTAEERCAPAGDALAS